MYKILSAILVLNLTLLPVYSEIRTVRTYPNQSNYNALYDNDLSVVEEYLFGGAYASDTLQSRLNRIERKLFAQCFPTLTFAQRMNRILSSYQGNYNDRNYVSDSYGKTPAQRFINRFFGQPTGFTPPVMNLPFNDYGQPYGMQRSFYNNRGSYNYSNETPAAAGIGVHILD